MIFFIPYTSFNGCFTTVLDVFYSYKKNKSLVVYNDKPITNLYSIMNLRFTKLLCTDIINSFSSVIPKIIHDCCSSCSLLTYVIENNIVIKGNNLYLVDSGDLFKLYLNNKIDMVNYAFKNNLKYNKIYLIISKNNIPYIKNIDNIEIILFKHFLSRYRLENTNVSNNNECITSEYYKNIKNRKNINIHTYKEYRYNRWFKYNNIVYFENIGKLLFEFIYFNKKVSYTNRNKCIDDGLTYMFRRFGIDDNYNHIVSNILNKKDIELELLEKEFII